MNIERKKYLVVLLLIFAVALSGSFFSRNLAPAASAAAPSVFEVKKGQGFFEIIENLHSAQIIRSARAAKFYVVLTGQANELKPGAYNLSSGMRVADIVRALVRGPVTDAKVVIPEGANIYEIDSILSDKGITLKGEFAKYALKKKLEGKLFPDTYYLYLNSAPPEVADVFLRNFEAKAGPLLAASGRNADKVLILASLLEKEVPDFEEQKTVAGILLRRIEIGMPLQVDATVCYIKKLKKGENSKCRPLTEGDFQAESAYNTYLYKGWPPGPIANPGEKSLRAALSPADSDYWFYLSDPETLKTIFSKTLDSHRENRVKYLSI